MDLVRHVPRPQEVRAHSESLVTREWLVTNGLGGYAAGSLSGVITRRYHGLLIAALPAPFGRTVMMSHLAEEVQLASGRTAALTAAEHYGTLLELHVARYLVDFSMEDGLPVWRFSIDGTLIEKRLVLPHMQNTVYVTYRLAEGDQAVRLRLRPSMHFRPHDGAVSQAIEAPYVFTAVEDRYEVSSAHSPSLHMQLQGANAAFTVQARTIANILYRVEQSRGYDAVGELWSPGTFGVDIPPRGSATLVASTESWETMTALAPQEALESEQRRRRRLLTLAHGAARDPMGAELVLAADQFIIQPAGRVEEAATAHAAGDEVRTVVAGYHWFTDWGRDTMISLEGLTLVTGRHTEAGNILRTFGHYIRDGLIPNLFPEGEREGLYHTADATLWFFHAIARYVEATGDRDTLRLLLPRLLDVLDHHLRGTRYGIGVDPADGLLRQGEQGYQLTWMDAKVDDWVVTPRRGKAVEINALWYNALCLLETWVREEQGDAAARPIADHAARARASFNRRFWYAEGGYLYDVVDGEVGDDAACRPNQVLAIALAHPVLDRVRWASVLETVEQRLLTPYGLRSLAPGSRDYKPQYYGDLRARDAAYHQGTVWAWLIGPFIDAWLKLHPGESVRARTFLTAFTHVMNEACVGSIAEIFDAEEPFTPRGCVAQAWSVAEVLRSWVKTGEGGAS
ncbi:MAG: amylo-alpha-1,6-glucosidase [Bacteroidales bacterium]